MTTYCEATFTKYHYGHDIPQGTECMVRRLQEPGFEEIVPTYEVVYICTRGLSNRRFSLTMSEQECKEYLKTTNTKEGKKSTVKHSIEYKVFRAGYPVFQSESRTAAIEHARMLVRESRLPASVRAFKEGYEFFEVESFYANN